MENFKQNIWVFNNLQNVEFKKDFLYNQMIIIKEQ